MIISLRGNGGSGKSTLVRSVMRRYVIRRPVHREGRRRPFGYWCEAFGRTPLYVVGHYETACGGGDTITSVEDVFQSVTSAAETGAHVIFEGIISQDDVERTVRLGARHPLMVVLLTTPLDVCLASIELRRQARQASKPLNPRNTTARAKTVIKVADRLEAAGVRVQRLSREEALSYALTAFGVADLSEMEEEFTLR